MRHVQLRAFHHVAIHGGFSRAAEKLALTQPAISDQVTKLEQHYDVLLFDRSKKQVVLTPFGEQLLAITSPLFEMEQQARELLSETRALRSGTLRIMADSPHHLLQVLTTFRKKYPGVFVSLQSGNTDTVTAALTRYQADIGILGEVPGGRAFASVKLSSTPVIAFTKIGYLPSGTEKMTISEIARFPLVVREKGSKTRQILDRFAAKNGVKLKAAIEVEGREAVREIVASGFGIGFVSKAEFGHDKRLKEISISGLHEHMDEALICLRDRQNNKLIKAFMAIAAG